MCMEGQNSSSSFVSKKYPCTCGQVFEIKGLKTSQTCRCSHLFGLCHQNCNGGIITKIVAPQMETYKFWVKVNLHASLMCRDIFEASSKENKDRLLHVICYGFFGVFFPLMVL